MGALAVLYRAARAAANTRSRVAAEILIVSLWLSTEADGGLRAAGFARHVGHRHAAPGAREPRFRAAVGRLAYATASSVIPVPADQAGLQLISLAATHRPLGQSGEFRGGPCRARLTGY